MKAYWNYRVLEFMDPTTGEPWRSIHEVHYEDDKPRMYTEDPAEVLWEVSEGDDAAKRQLEGMQRALTMPVLVETDFQ